MNNTLCQFEDTAYTLTDGLRERTPRAKVRRALPNETEREELLIRKLGARGWGRVFQFRYYYGSDWGDTHGETPSPRAVDAFFRFLEAASFPANCTPSVFLTDRGGIELCWEDEGGKTAQVEFTSTFAEFFRAATNAEGTVPIREVSLLMDILFAHHAA